MRRKPILVSLTALMLVIIVSCVWLFFNLDVGEEPKVSDVIIVAEGISEERSVRAGELLEDGYSESDMLIVSPLYTPDHMFDMSYAYRDAGVDVPNQVIPENEATSTWTNAVNTLEIMEENGWNSAIVVTSDFHTRRTELSFERVNKDYGFDLTFVSAYLSENGQKISYYENNSNTFYAILEIPKYYAYLIGLYQWIDL